MKDEMDDERDAVDEQLEAEDAELEKKLEALELARSAPTAYALLQQKQDHARQVHRTNSGSMPARFGVVLCSA